MVYSLYSADILRDSIDCGVEGGVRFDSKHKMKTSPLMGPSKDEVNIGCSDKTKIFSDNTSVTFSVVSAEPAS